MAGSSPRAAKLGWIVIPLALAPLVLGRWAMDGTMFIVNAVAICFAAPAAGFWLGELRGQTGATKAGMGCIATLGFFAAYLLWVLVIARWIFG